MNVIKTFTLMLGLILTSYSFAGFYVSGNHLYDSNGQRFVMRGVNHAHTWYTQQLNNALSGIAATGSNTVRVVLSNGHRWTKNSASDIATIIQQAKHHQLVVVLEVHDTTGYGEEGAAATLSSAADYWVEMKDQLIGQEDYVIINIGNEPFGNGTQARTWVNEHNAAIHRLRSAGLTHTLMVDAPNWGQDWQDIMLNNAQTIFNADPQKNTIFSVHMYEVFGSYNRVSNYLSAFSNQGLVLVVGEFAATHKGANVDEDSILERSESLGIGYLGWSWSGNGASTADLDIVNNWNNQSLSRWGDRLINGNYGIRTTSVIASVYTCGEQCGDNSGEYPICSSAAVDPDGDGWGWENNQSCIVQGSSSTASNGYPYCSSSAADPDGDGWGWENSTSCVVKGSSADNG